MGVIKGKISISAAFSVFFSVIIPVNAQISPDSSLGSESSIVNNLDALRKQIDGGALRGTNLFHSFREFNINNGESVYFTNPAGVLNILSRVTGGNPSNIFGKLGVSGNANLFLINPSGIIFGAGSSLDLRGSFTATTGDRVNLGDGGYFSATDLNGSSLLSVSPAAMFLNQLQPATGAIISKENLNTPGDLNLIGSNVELENALNVGGNLYLSGTEGVKVTGAITAGSVNVLSGGKITIATINTSPVDGIFAGNGGAIYLYGTGDINILPGRITTDGLVAGAVTVESGGNIYMDSSRLRSRGFTDRNDLKNGDINFRGNSIFLIGGSTVNGANFSGSRGGEMNFNARDTLKMGGSNINSPYAVITKDVVSGGTGGDININADRVLIEDGAVIGSYSFDTGRGIDININATSYLELSGVDGTGAGSGIFTAPIGDNQGGSVNIRTARAVIDNGAFIGALSLGPGNAGNVYIEVTDSVILRGIQNDGSRIYSISLGDGRGGDIFLGTERLLLQDGSQINSSTFAGGDAGNISLRVSDRIELTGTNIRGGTSFIGAVTTVEATGNAGNISIETGDLSVRDGGNIYNTSFSEGNSGEINITTRGMIELVGTDINNAPSGIFSNARGSGTGGNIRLKAAGLSLREGAIINASGISTGNAGNISIDVSGDVSLSGRSPIGFPTRITTSAAGTGDAGTVSARVDGTLSLLDSEISTAAANASGGSIEVEAGDIRLRGTSNIRTDVANGSGDGGSIELRANSIVLFNDSNILAFSLDGRGGNIDLATPVFLGNGFSPLPTTPAGLENNGRVDINATGIVSGIITIPDLNFIQNSFSLDNPEIINTEELISNSCVVPEREGRGTFIIRGNEDFPARPDRTPPADFRINSVEPLGSASTSIVEPNGIYKLPDGRVLLSRRCSRSSIFGD